METRPILDALRDAVVVVDAAGMVRFVNRAAGALLKRDPDQLLGCPVAAVVPARFLSTDPTRAPTLVPALTGTDSDRESARRDALEVGVLDARGVEIPVEAVVDATEFDGHAAAVWTLRASPNVKALKSRLALRDALSAMADAFVKMDAHPQPEIVAQTVVETLVQRLGAAGARLWIADGGRNKLRLLGSAGFAPSVDRADQIGIDREPYGLGLSHVLLTGQPRLSPETDRDDRVAPPAWFRTEGLVGYAMQPLVFGEEFVGAIAYFSREPIDPELSQLLAVFARHAGVALHDVTQQDRARRQIEALAREAHARTGEFEAIVSYMPDAVFVVRDGRISFVNHSAVRMLGFRTPEELQVPLERFAEIAGVRDAAGVAVPVPELTWSRVLKGEVVTGVERRLAGTNSGRDLWVQISGAPLRDRAGNVLGGVVVATEITRLKELEHNKDEWLAIAAHELRTPLTPITVHLQMAQRRLHMGRPLDPDVFDKALEQVKRLSRLVNGLLDVTRLQAGQLDLALEELDLRDVAETVVDRMRHFSPRHTLVIDADAERVAVRGDRVRLDEVVTALVDNAIKYSPEGGEVWVTVRNVGEDVELSVRDEGIGIAPNERAQIFERYFRAGSVPSTQYGGLGLGLWIAGKVVQKHRGRIELQSEPGRGSTFTVIMPMSASAVSSASEAEGAGRARVLLVDDDLSVLEAVQSLLREDGYDVRVAGSGAEALEQARHWKPDVMLLDLRMPGMDGWEVRRRFLADPQLADVPVVMVSADRDARLGAQGKQIQAFVAKPFDLDEIERVLTDVLASRGQRAVG